VEHAPQTREGLESHVHPGRVRAKTHTRESGV
jgi:hypothetical protein